MSEIYNVVLEKNGSSKKISNEILLELKPLNLIWK